MIARLWRLYWRADAAGDRVAMLALAARIAALYRLEGRMG